MGLPINRGLRAHQVPRKQARVHRWIPTNGRVHLESHFDENRLQRWGVPQGQPSALTAIPVPEGIDSTGQATPHAVAITGQSFFVASASVCFQPLLKLLSVAIRVA